MKLGIYLILATYIVACTKVQTLNGKKGVYVPVRKTNLEGKLSWRGSIRSSKRVEIRADRRFKIHKVAINNLAEVKKNQLLIEVDQTEAIKKKVEINDKIRSFALDVESHQIKFKQVEEELNRKKILYRKGVIPKKEFEMAEREFRLANTEKKQKELEKERLHQEEVEIEASIKNSNFYSPIEGIISGLEALNTPDGEINQGTLLAVVSDPQSLAMSVAVEETVLDYIKPGIDVSMVLEGISNDKLTGKVLEVSKTPIESEGRIKTFEMLISLGNPSKNLREGLTGKATIIYVRKENVISVPLISLKQLDGKNYVMAASKENGEAQAKNVNVGLKTEDEIEILSGVAEGEFVVVDNG